MSIDVGGVRDVVARALGPAHEVDLVGGEVGDAAVGVRPVEGDLDRLWRAGDGVGPVAVVPVQALAGQVVIRIIVVGLVGVDRHLIEQVGRTSIAHDEHDVVLIAEGVDQPRQKDATGPGGRHQEAVARGPPAVDQASGGVGSAWRLGRACQRAAARHQAASQALIPPDAVDVDRERLRRVDGHIEGDRRPQSDARRRGVTLDLIVDVVGHRGTQHPGRRPRLRVLELDEIGRCRMSQQGINGRGQKDAHQ